MGSQKGYTALEAVIWFLAATVCILSVIGALSLWPHPSRADTDTPAQGVTIQSVATVLKIPKYQKVIINDIVSVECGEYDCGAALKAFEKEFRACDIVPIGPYIKDGNTTHYYFLVGGGQ